MLTTNWSTNKPIKGSGGNFWRWSICLLSLMEWRFLEYIHMCKLIKLSTLKRCVCLCGFFFLHVNHTSIQVLITKTERFLVIPSHWKGHGVPRPHFRESSLQPLHSSAYLSSWVVSRKSPHASITSWPQTVTALCPLGVWIWWFHVAGVMTGRNSIKSQ